MVGLYIGSTTGYSGKNLLAMALGLKLKESGLKVGYMKPVGAVPHMDGDKPGDADAAFIQEVLGLEQDSAKVTPVLVTRDFTIKAFSEDMGDLMPSITESYEELSQNKDVMIIGGSGSYLSSGTYCGVSGPDVARAMGAKTILVDRYSNELRYDYVLRVQKELGDDFWVLFLMMFLNIIWMSLNLCWFLFLKKGELGFWALFHVIRSWVLSRSVIWLSVFSGKLFPPMPRLTVWLKIFLSAPCRLKTLSPTSEDIRTQPS